MASIFDYQFNNMGRIGLDSTDQSQKNVYNTRFTNYTLSNYFSNVVSDNHVNFAIQQPTTMFSGMTSGHGLINGLVDDESKVLYTAENGRLGPGEHIMLMSRPFATVPYLGRGSCDPALESQLQQGEIVHDKKSVSTIMEKSFGAYSLYPTDDKMQDRVNDPAKNVEEAAMNGWTRGGMMTRDMSQDPKLQQGNRPSASF
jgi:hypothetical protein